MEGEDEAEGRPFTLTRLYVDPALVVVGHVAHDGQPEPRTPGVPAPPVVDAVEAFENSIEVAGGDPDAAVLHGEADVRVPISQGYELYNALKRQGVPTKMVVYPRTSHGPREPKFLLDIMQRQLEWVDRYLGKQ